MKRVASALALAESQEVRAQWAHRFLAALRAGFIPAGRILAGAGRDGESTWVNCFVQPLGTAATCTHPVVPGGPETLEAQALEEAVRTLRGGGGVGLDFSGAANPVAMLRAFDSACSQATAGSVRPGAMMGVLRVDHPDIDAFIEAKLRGGLAHFNLCVAVTDAFMQRLAEGEAISRARWDRLSAAAWACGEPGVVFIDTIRRDDSLGALETISAVNPCGEQPLPPYGSCCLGSVNLTRFVRRGLTPNARFDHEALRRTARVAVRMLDNVIELTPWPLAAQAVQARHTRRIGLGVTGLADALILLGVRYSHAEGRAQAAVILRTLRDAAFNASIALARERGPFPAFNKARHLAPPGYASRLPAVLRAGIGQHGLRHSHLLSLAPAASISLAMAGGVSSGVEPAWGWQVERRQRQADEASVAVRTVDPVWRRWCRRYGASAALPPAFETIADISPAAQLAMVAALAPLIDGAISKTVQLPPSSTPHTVARLFRHAWRLGVKGLTVYRPNELRRPVIGLHRSLTSGQPSV